MFSLIKIEWLKIKRYPAFWWMLGIVSLTYPGVNMMFYYGYSQSLAQSKDVGAIVKMILGNPFTFPETWHSVAYFSSFFILLPSILVIMLVTNEYTFRTHRQNIIDGWSRDQFITSKLCDVLIISVVITIVYSLVALSFGLYVDSNTSYRWSEQLYYIPLFFLQTFAQLSIAFLLGYLLKKAFISLGIFLFYYLVVENIAVTWMQFKLNDLGRFLPFEISDRLIPPPAFMGRFNKDYDKVLHAIPQFVVYSIVLTALIWLLCFRVHRKRDL
ncbi:ABC transporter permease [Sediminibacterium soli]|uniref:ABC transporter permease n=1 Tax=Sediminibacterium soli TaxID=2698829 RepID=UPI00137A27A5|nr:ABC transporter permease [Sediminibacterium soli]NCI48021.1 ABC transporter permease subunit [Sediminibacterium soli]